MSKNTVVKTEQPDFSEVVHLIAAARQHAYQAVNTTLIDLYWQVGAYISNKIKAAEWGDGVVDALAKHLAVTQPNLQGFTRRNLFRMRQFYETYQDDQIVSPLVRQLPWTHNLIILSQSKHAEEREFYLRMAIKERWSKRELERQLGMANTPPPETNNETDNEATPRGGLAVSGNRNTGRRVIKSRWLG